MSDVVDDEVWNGICKRNEASERLVLKIYKCNEKFITAQSTGKKSTSDSFPARLQNMMNSTLLEVEGCVFLKALFEADHSGRQSFPDDTGYECFVNHIHMDDFVDDNLVSAGIVFLNEISIRLNRQLPNRQFTGIISADNEGCVVRFHSIRPGEQWVGDDLEAYEEAVCVFSL